MGVKLPHLSNCYLSRRPALIIVEDATVPHQGAMGRGDDQFVEGGDAVRMGH